MDLEVLDLEAIDMAGLKVMGSEVMLILFILKPTLHNHPIKLRRKFMSNLNKPIVNLNKHMPHLNKRMRNLNKRMHNLKRPMRHLNKRMLNQQPHTQRLPSLHIKIKRTASNLKSDIRNNLFTKRVDIFKNPFKDIMMQQPLLVEIELTIFYQLFILYVINLPNRTSIFADMKSTMN